MNKLSRSLVVKDYEMKVHLGCTAQERLVAQRVQISFEFQTQYIEGDTLVEAYDYARLCKEITALTQGKEFETLEYLSESFLAYLLKQEFKLKHMRVRKVSPPIENLKGGVEFGVEVL